MDRRTHEKALGLDAIFPTVERQIVQDPDLQSSRNRESFDKSSGKRKAIDSPQWREAVKFRFAANIPMALLIQEFKRYYYRASNSKRISQGGTYDQECKPLAVKRKQKDRQFFNLPDDILENIFLRIPLLELLASRSVCDDWAAVYASQHFQSVYDRTDKCILINNNNLDIWAFFIATTRWFEMKVPCDWDKFGLKTLGLKAGSDGLFLVARSDFTLFVVNPLSAQFKSLPKISPGSGGHDEFIKSLIIHGTAEMQVDRDGDYKIYLFGNWQNREESFVHLARYTSVQDLWTIERISITGIGLPLLSRIFPSPLWSFRRDNVITCVSTSCQYFHYSCDNTNNPPNAATVHVNLFMNSPAMMDFEYRHDEICYENVALPTVVPYNSGGVDHGLILVGRLKENYSVKPKYGKIPVVRHSQLGIWQFSEFDNQIPGEWILIDTIQDDFIDHMIASSGGTDFLVVGNGRDSIWFLLKGSNIMLEFKISSKLWTMYEIACPGGGSMDANLHWKAVFGCLRFSAKV